MVLAVGVAFLGSLLVGCSQGETAPHPINSTQSVVVFESTRDAQVAAEAVYTKYATASDLIGRAGGTGLDGLKPLVTPRAFEDEIVGAEYLRKRQLRVVGRSKLVEFRVQNADLPTGDVTAYACLDVSASRVIDHIGKDVTPAGRQIRQTSIVRFVWRNGRLLLDGTSAWSGEPIC